MGDVNIRWITVQSYKQRDSWECGYYVMFWMNEIVVRRIVSDWKTVSIYVIYLSFIVLTAR